MCSALRLPDDVSLWDEETPTGRSGSARVRRHRGRPRRHAGVALAHGFRPRQRAGMASGTADLQRDLGGSIMQSILGALLTAGYSAAVAERDRGVAEQQPDQRQDRGAARAVVCGCGEHRQGGTSVRQSDPGRREVIVRRRRRWAYLAGIVAALLGFVVVFFFYPKKHDEQRLLAEYAEEDTAPRPSPAP